MNRVAAIAVAGMLALGACVPVQIGTGGTGVSIECGDVAALPLAALPPAVTKCACPGRVPVKRTK